MRSNARPGIRKTQHPPLLRERQVSLWQSNDYGMRHVLESADVMSEGATRSEGGAFVYYGTTSVILPFRSAGGHIPDERQNDVLRFLSFDPHLRLRVLRLARQEARLRARGELGCVHAELRFTVVEQGVQIDVEVEALAMVVGQSAINS